MLRHFQTPHVAYPVPNVVFIPASEPNKKKVISLVFITLTIWVTHRILILRKRAGKDRKKCEKNTREIDKQQKFIEYFLLFLTSPLNGVKLDFFMFN